MNIGDWVMYEATHSGDKVVKLGKIRWVEPHWVDVAWYWSDDGFMGLNSTTNVMRKYCTVLTNEVAQVFLTANKPKEL